MATSFAWGWSPSNIQQGTSAGRLSYVKHTREVGAAGFLKKQASAEILTKAIREVARGNTFISPFIAKRLRDDSIARCDRNGLRHAIGNRLTSRESEVLQLVAEGSANKQIAALLAISVKTVEKHRQHLRDKLDIHDTASLTRYAIAAGVESSAPLTIA